MTKYAPTIGTTWVDSFTGKVITVTNIVLNEKGKYDIHYSGIDDQNNVVSLKKWRSCYGGKEYNETVEEAKDFVDAIKVKIEATETENLNAYNLVLSIKDYYYALYTAINDDIEYPVSAELTIFENLENSFALRSVLLHIENILNEIDNTLASESTETKASVE